MGDGALHNLWQLIQSAVGWFLVFVMGILWSLIRRRIAKVDQRLDHHSDRLNQQTRELHALETNTVSKGDFERGLARTSKDMSTQIDYVRREGQAGRDALEKVMKTQHDATTKQIDGVAGNVRDLVKVLSNDKRD